jgi:hypothetical protein
LEGAVSEPNASRNVAPLTIPGNPKEFLIPGFGLGGGTHKPVLPAEPFVRTSGQKELVEVKWGRGVVATGLRAPGGGPKDRRESCWSSE